MTSIVLTSEQVASVIAQQGGAPGPILPPPPPPPPPPPVPPVEAPPGGRVIHLVMGWANPARQYVEMGPDDVLVVETTTGGVSTGGSLPRFGAAEYQSPPSSRIATLSLKPGDFGDQPTLGAKGEGNSVTMVFAIGTGSGFGYYPVFPPNTKIFLNIKNSPGCTCREQGVCGMFVDLLKVAGL